MFGFNKHIGYYVTKPQNPKEETFGVTFKLKHNENGVVVFDECSLWEEWMEETKVPKKKEVKKEEKKDEKKDEEKEGEMKAEEEEFEVKKTKKEKYSQIKYEANTFEAYSEKELQEFFSTESTMMNQDRIIIETYERKNELESLSYTWREKLNGKFQEYTRPEDVAPLLSFLEAMSEWLYGEGQESNRGTYVNKINEVREKVGPIEKRYNTFEEIREESGVLITSMKTQFEFLNSLVSMHLCRIKSMNTFLPRNAKTLSTTSSASRFGSAMPKRSRPPNLSGKNPASPLPISASTTRK